MGELRTPTGALRFTLLKTFRTPTERVRLYLRPEVSPPQGPWCYPPQPGLPHVPPLGPPPTPGPAPSFFPKPKVLPRRKWRAKRGELVPRLMGMMGSPGSGARSKVPHFVARTREGSV